MSKSVDSETMIKRRAEIAEKHLKALEDRLVPQMAWNAGICTMICDCYSCKLTWEDARRLGKQVARTYVKFELDVRTRVVEARRLAHAQGKSIFTGEDITPSDEDYPSYHASYHGQKQE